MNGIALLLAALVWSGCGPADVPVPGPSPARGLPAGTSHESIQSAGRERIFAVHRPPSGPAATGYPLVVVLHGGFGTGAQAEAAYGWDEQADAAGFLVAYPDGIDRAWNAGGGCCGAPARDDVDDVAFLAAVVARIGDLAPVDAKRVYATGMSNGAIMAYRLACETDIFAAVAPVAGNQLVDCSRGAPASLLHIHGDADTRVRMDGSRGEGVAQIAGPAVEDVVAGWRTRDSCGEARTSTRGAVTASVASCAAGRSVELLVVAGAGHQWPGAVAKGFPGADPPSDALSATATIWTFFSEHPAP
nr:PHB depolymerase family esterase [Propionicimonas sp.]